MIRGTELIESIRHTDVEEGALVYWRLGQQSYAVRTRRLTLYFDLFLSDHGKRLVPPPFAPLEVTNADAFFGTHDHRDHIDRESLAGLAEGSPQAPFFAPRQAAATMPEDGMPASRIVPMDDEVVQESEGMRVTAIKAAHESFDATEEYGHPYLQYVVEADGVVIHHAGDTLRYEGMAPRLAKWDLTVSFLPINGRDAERLRRNCIGNMVYQEAADLAGFVRPRLTVPGHYEMFAGNSEEPQRFLDYMAVKYPNLACHASAHNVPVRVAAKE